MRLCGDVAMVNVQAVLPTSGISAESEAEEEVEEEVEEEARHPA